MSVPMRWEVETVSECPVVESKARRLPHRKNSLRLAVVLCGAVGLGGLTAVGVQKAIQALQPVPELRLEKESSAGGQVALGSASVERRLGFVTITGDVTSQTGQDLPRVEAVVELLDARQHTVRMESALIGMASLAPNGSSPFQVEMPDDSRAVSYRVRFRQLAGIALN